MNETISLNIYKKGESKQTEEITRPPDDEKKQEEEGKRDQGPFISVKYPYICVILIILLYQYAQCKIRFLHL